MSNKEFLESELLLLEQSLLNPDIRKSANYLGCLLSDDFIEIGSAGRVYSKDEVIKAMLIEDPVNIKLEDFRVSLLCSEIVLVTYKAVKFGLEGSDNFCSLRSSIWKLLNGGWKIVFHQGTVVQK